MKRRRKRTKTIGYPERSFIYLPFKLIYAPRFIGLVAAAAAIIVAHFWCKNEICFIVVAAVVAIIVGWIGWRLLEKWFPFP